MRHMKCVCLCVLSDTYRFIRSKNLSWNVRATWCVCVCARVNSIFRRNFSIAFSEILQIHRECLGSVQVVALRCVHTGVRFERGCTNHNVHTYSCCHTKKREAYYICSWGRNARLFPTAIRTSACICDMSMADGGDWYCYEHGLFFYFVLCPPYIVCGVRRWLLFGARFFFQFCTMPRFFPNCPCVCVSHSTMRCVLTKRARARMCVCVCVCECVPLIHTGSEGLFDLFEAFVVSVAFSCVQSLIHITWSVRIHKFVRLMGTFCSHRVCIHFGFFATFLCCVFGLVFCWSHLVCVFFFGGFSISNSGLIACVNITCALFSTLSLIFVVVFPNKSSIPVSVGCIRFVAWIIRIVCIATSRRYMFDCVQIKRHNV